MIEQLFPRFAELEVKLPNHAERFKEHLLEPLARCFELDSANILYPNKYDSQRLINEQIDTLLEEEEYSDEV